MIRTTIKQWCDTTELKLAKSAGEDIDFIRAEVKSGGACLWHFESANHEAHVVTRLEDRELVIVCFEGSGLDEFGRLITQDADSCGYTIRAHVSDPRVMRMLGRHDFLLDHHVLKRGVKNGRAVSQS